MIAVAGHMALSHPVNIYYNDVGLVMIPVHPTHIQAWEIQINAEEEAKAEKRCNQENFFIIDFFHV